MEVVPSGRTNQGCGFVQQNVNSNSNVFTSITLHNNLLAYTRGTLRATLSVARTRKLCTKRSGLILLRRVKFNAVQATEERHNGNENSEHKMSKVDLFCFVGFGT